MLLIAILFVGCFAPNTLTYFAIYIVHHRHSPAPVTAITTIFTSSPAPKYSERKERKIYQKLKYDYDWFLKRVRRLVPAPHILEERYMEVYEQYKDICCSKTGEKLFATPASHNVHKATLKHIQRNCLSDIPLESYYSPIREDRLGLTVNHCFRGTPGNEGLHQKMRQLVRGFSNSPRFVFALLTDYFLIWNQSIDIRLRGLPSKYDGLYCSDLLEYEIDKMALWKNRDTPPHPDWLSTRSLFNPLQDIWFLG